MQNMAPPGVVRSQLLCHTSTAGHHLLTHRADCVVLQTMSADMIRQASEMFKNMSPEDMEQMMEVASSMRAGGSAGAAGGPSNGGTMPSAQDLQGLLNNPEAMKMASNMMRSMKAEDLARMSRSAGLNITPQQAEAMTQQMQNLTPEQMAKIMAAAGAMQAGLARVKQGRDWVMRNKGLVLALLVLLVAWLLRRWLSRRSAHAAPVAAVVDDRGDSATWS